MQKIIETVELAHEALRAIERGVPQAGLVTEPELRERARGRLVKALEALEADFTRPCGVA